MVSPPLPPPLPCLLGCVSICLPSLSLSHYRTVFFCSILLRRHFWESLFVLAICLSLLCVRPFLKQDIHFIFSPVQFHHHQTIQDPIVLIIMPRPPPSPFFFFSFSLIINLIHPRSLNEIPPYLSVSQIIATPQYLLRLISILYHFIQSPPSPPPFFFPSGPIHPSIHPS